MATVIHKGANTVFFHLAALVVVVMVVVMAMLLFLVIILVMMLMMMVMMFVLIFVVVVIIVVIVLNHSAFHFLNPGGRGGHLVKVEHVGIEDLVEVHLAIVARDDLGGRLQGTDDALHATQFLGRDF